MTDTVKDKIRETVIIAMFTATVKAGDPVVDDPKKEAFQMYWGTHPQAKSGEVSYNLFHAAADAAVHQIIEKIEAVSEGKVVVDRSDLQNWFSLLLNLKSHSVGIEIEGNVMERYLR